MKKTERNAVRTFLIKDKQVVCIKYKTLNIGYFDIPGGKIENGESPQNAAIREFKEETGIEINNLDELGNIIVEYPSKIYNIKIFKANNYKGVPQEFVENESFWIEIDELLQQKNRFAITYLLQSEFMNELINKNINIKFIVDENHNIIEYTKYYN